MTSIRPLMWFTFLKTCGMLLVVIAILVLVLYLIKRFSMAKGIYPKGKPDFIKVLALHYVSPKEKILLLKVIDKKILIGVTPQNITFLENIDENNKEKLEIKS
ncbi:MAG: flagellar biosynthetic protein FliO [Desulfobacteraceae bacterium 4572_130]|nr:MAG: flagellar biosynthetic protein FliO [Desulfobacteraceae bacterium 4572_130]